MAKRKVGDEKGAEVPLSSMIDVVFLLLIYFILTQKPVIEDVHLQVNLPAPNASSSSNKPVEMLTIDVMKTRAGLDNDDQIAKELKNAEQNKATLEQKNAIKEKERSYYYINGQPYEARDLRKYLETVAQASTDTTVVINCGPNAKHKKLVRLLDMCSELGLTKLNIINDPSVAFQQDPIEKR